MALRRAKSARKGALFQAAPEWAIFVCDDRRFALPLKRVREILLPRGFTRLPGCGASVCGLIGLRGRVITVFDLGAVLGLRPSVETDDYRLLLVEHGERVVGAVVERVESVGNARMRNHSPRSKLLRGLGVDPEQVSGIGGRGDEAFVALDPDRLLGRLLVSNTARAAAMMG